MENLLNELQEHYILLILNTLNFWSLITSKIIIQSILVQLMERVEKVLNKERDAKMRKKNEDEKNYEFFRKQKAKHLHPNGTSLR